MKMLSKQTQLAQLQSLTGRLFREDDWTFSELSELLSQSDSSRPCSTALLSIPLVSAFSHSDPRMDNKDYQRLFFESWEREGNPLNLMRKRLNLVLGLEGTLISLATESDSIRVSHVSSNASILSNSSRIVTAPLQGQTLIIAVRPGVDDFLRKVKAVADLYLVSRLSHSVVKAALKAVEWEELFEDIYSQAETKGIGFCFPRLLDAAAKSLTLAFDDQLSFWQSNDLPYVIPSKRYWPLDRFILKTNTLIYHIDADTSHRETLSTDIYSLYEVEPGSNQLEIVASRLQSVAFEMYFRRYKSEVRSLFFNFRIQSDRLFVAIADLNRKLEAIALIRACDKQRVELLSQASVLVVDRPVPNSRLPVLQEAALIQAFFCVESR